MYPGRFGPDGTLIAIGSPPQGIELRDASRLEPVGERLPTGDVSMFDFSPDGRILASIDWAGIATIWDVKVPEGAPLFLGVDSRVPTGGHSSRA